MLILNFAACKMNVYLNSCSGDPHGFYINHYLLETVVPLRLQSPSLLHTFPASLFPLSSLFLISIFLSPSASCPHFPISCLLPDCSDLQTMVDSFWSFKRVFNVSLLKVISLIGFFFSLFKKKCG